MKRGVWLTECTDPGSRRYHAFGTVWHTRLAAENVVEWHSRLHRGREYRAVRYVRAELTRKPRKRRKR